MIACKDIYFQYDSDHNQDKRFTLSCDLFKAQVGKITIILGGNGTGKTTFLKLLAGRLIPIRGSVDLKSSDIGWFDVRAADNLVDNLTVIDHLALALYSSQADVPFIPRSGNRAFYLDRLKNVGGIRSNLCDMLEKYVYELSSGQRQILSIILAMLGGRNVLLTDESTANLDFVNGKMFFECLKRVCLTNGTAVIVVTHDLILANDYGDCYYCICNGVIKPLDINSMESSERLNILKKAVFEE